MLMRVTQGKGRKAPKEEVSLRDIDPVQFQVVIRGNSSPLETLDQKQTYMRLHPGAIYLNQQTSYFVEELDLTKKIAWVIPRDSRKIEYYTECREHAMINLAGGGSARAAVLPRAAGAEDPEELQRKLQDLLELCKEANYIVVFTGAGISTSIGLPDYRGCLFADQMF
eukprot:g14746.t1